jgi:1A family penicillin-binding protein
MPFKRLRRHADYSGFKKIKIFSSLSSVAFYGLLVFVLVIIALVIYFFTQIPSPDALTTRDVAQATEIFDRNGQLLYNIYADENRTPIKLQDIPDSVKKATVAIEDKNFYTHQGFDITGILRSFVNLIIHREVEGGGSTLTQQLVKNALLTSDQSFVRKIKELILAVEVEHTYTKDQILEMYLNEVPYGGTSYGIQAASNLYFGKDAKDLDLAQSALLAGLPQLPSVYSPYGTHPELAKVRQKEVLNAMVAQKYITQQQADAAAGEQLTFRTTQNQIGFKAPHFVLFVKQKLIEQFGDKMVEKGGLKVTTTLDYSLQEKAQQIVHDQVGKLKDYKVGNGGAVVMDPKTGQILTMIGSKDYFAESEPANCTSGVDCVFEGNYNITVNPRQPGSSTKPITYSAALEKGYTAASVLEDVKTQFPGGAGQNDYSPVNYDGQFRGPVQVRYALGNSLNIPAVKMLADVGVKNVMDLAFRMGISTWEPTDDNVSQVGLSLVLGGREVNLLDLTTAYSVFADQGMKHDPVSILKVTDGNGKVLFEDHTSDGVRVLDPGISYVISNILADNGARSLAFGTNSVLVIPGKTVSVKTGTTDQKRDNWAVGYTPSYVVGVWVGNNDNEVMNPAIASGITGASPIWAEIMKTALSGKPDEPYQRPDNVSQVDIDGLMGGQPKDGSPTRKEFFIKGTEPNSVSSAYQHVKVCKTNVHRQANDGEDAQDVDGIILQENDPTGANKWQEGIDQWVLNAANARFIGVVKGCNGIPGFSGGGSTGGVVSIANIPNGANVPRVFDVLAGTNSPNGIKQIQWQVDGANKSTQTSQPFALHVEFPQGDKGSHTITVTLTDNNGQTFSSSIGVTVNL